MLPITHHGAVQGVTGSCHQLHLDENNSLLIDIGLFQGAETSGKGGDARHLEIEFDISSVQALIITHVHIDHVGRLPYLLAAGFSGPIYCSHASAKLLPLVIEDALKVGVTRNKSIINACLARLSRQLVPLDYKTWYPIALAYTSTQASTSTQAKVKLAPAGHILGSAYVCIRVEDKLNKTKEDVVFSGDLGAPYAPLLPAPKSPYRADQLVIESTYGDKQHVSRRQRQQRLQASLERAVADVGVVLIPAFSIGRTQELLYEIENIIHKNHTKPISHTRSGKVLNWGDIDIIIDSPLASKFTQVYRQLTPYWDKEALRRKASGRHPLSFEQVTTIDSHQDHLATVDYLKRQARPAIVIAASGMCAGGRIVNYLKALIGDRRNDILFVGYQAQGTPGREILNYHTHSNGYVTFDGVNYPIKASVQQISGYSAHADQKDLLNFIKRMRHKPQQIRIVHGDSEAKHTFAGKIHDQHPQIKILIP